MLLNKLLPEANIAIILDQPSAEDDNSQKHLTEKLMTKLTGQLMAVGIFPDKCSILTVCQERHSKIHRITRGELLCWTEILRRDLNSISPNLIIAVGELAVKTITGKTDHSKYRGSVIPSILSDCKTLCMWSPDAISDPKTPWMKVYNVRPEWQPFTQWDCQKAARHAKTPEYLAPPLEMIMIKSRADFGLLDPFLSPDYVNNPDSRLACDIEASYCEMTCIGFAKENTKAYVIDLVHMSEKDLPYALLLINTILGTIVPKVFQNGNFDILYMAYYYHIKVENFYWDTMICFHSMFPNLPKGLGILGSIFTEIPFWKDESKGDDDKQWLLVHSKVDWPRFFLYNAKDTANLLTIWDIQAELLKARGTEETFRREMRLCKPLLTIEYFGTEINHGIKDKLAVELEEKIEKWTAFFDELCCNQAPNIQSPAQLKVFLYETLRLPTRVKKGKVSTDVDALTSLIRFNPIVLKTIMIMRDLKKQRSFTSLKTTPDLRVRTTFKPAGTQTGRLSSSKSITGGGSNLQQIPKWAREFYIPDSTDDWRKQWMPVRSYIEDA